MIIDHTPIFDQTQRIDDDMFYLPKLYPVAHMFHKAVLPPFEHEFAPTIFIFVVGVAQSVRASDCGPEGRGFDSHRPPHFNFL